MLNLYLKKIFLACWYYALHSRVLDWKSIPSKAEQSFFSSASPIAPENPQLIPFPCFTHSTHSRPRNRSVSLTEGSRYTSTTSTSRIAQRRRSPGRIAGEAVWRI